MSNKFNDIYGSSSPNEVQKTKMRETLSYNIGCIERNKSSDQSKLFLKAITSTLQRMNDSERKSNSDAEQSANLSFSDTFSESFLCGVQAAADDPDTTLKDRQVTETSVPMSTPTQVPQRKIGKRRTVGQNWTPIHGIRRKAIVQSSAEARLLNISQDAEPNGAEYDETGCGDLPHLDLSVDLFD